MADGRWQMADGEWQMADGQMGRSACGAGAGAGAVELDALSLVNRLPVLLQFPPGDRIIPLM